VKNAAGFLRGLANSAQRRNETDFLTTEDAYLFGGLAWEWLRNRPLEDPPPARVVSLVAGPDGLGRFCDALEKLWSPRRPIAGRVNHLLWAAAVLRVALPEDFWLPIEADALLVVLSPTYREMRVRAYNRASYVVPCPGPDSPRPRWQPFLNSIAIASEEHIPGRPDVLAAPWGIHELSHLVLITAPPPDESALPRRYVRWMLGQEGKTIATQIRISEEVRFRLPHPAMSGLFNRPLVSHGFAPVRAVAKPSRALLQAWVELSRFMSPPRVPGPRTLRTLCTNEDFAVGSLVYALKNRAIYTAGARARLIRSLLPAPLEPPESARGLEREVAALLAARSQLDAGKRRAATRANAISMKRFRVAELADFLSVLPRASSKSAADLGRAAATLDAGRVAERDFPDVDLLVSSALRRERPVLQPFGFEPRYADAHPSLFDIRA
jgi:hypothetical protein